MCACAVCVCVRERESACDCVWGRVLKQITRVKCALEDEIAKQLTRKQLASHPSSASIKLSLSLRECVSACVCTCAWVYLCTYLFPFLIYVAQLLQDNCCLPTCQIAPPPFLLLLFRSCNAEAQVENELEQQFMCVSAS